jgi:rubrerythrin
MTVEVSSAAEVLAAAIRAEDDASNLYVEVASRVGNPYLRQKLRLLAEEEVHHQRLLEEAYRKRFPDLPLSLPPSRLPVSIRSKAERDQLSIRELLSFLIEEEHRTRERYLACAEKSDVSDPALFRFLADWELSHQTALGAEYEMLVRYPRYFWEAVGTDSYG